MGKIKYMRDIREFFKRTPVVSSRDIAVFTKNRQYAHLLVSNLIKKGEIKRIVKGFYTIHEDPTISVFCFKPAYIGLQDALSIHGIWEQETNVVIVTAQKVKRSMIKVFDSRVILHRINPKYLFGYDVVRYGEFYIPVSDVEKTFIDLIYFNEIPDKKTIRALKKRLDQKKLKQYLRPYPQRLRKRILKMLEI
jgi:predicted transcriptional regulator of viral defense system